VILVSCEDVSSVEFDFGLWKPVVEKQPDNSWDGDIEVYSGDPVMAVGLEVSFEFAYFAPALEVVVVVGAFFDGDDLGELPAEQGKCSPCADYTDGHIVFVQYEDVTVQR